MEDNLKLGVEILNALDNADYATIEKIILTGKRSLNEITPVEKWNWLHKALLGFDKNKPPKESIEYLINQNIDVNAQDIYGMTPLHYAMRSKNAAAAITLLNAGADPNIPNRDGLIPLSMIGYIREHLDVLELMLKNGGNVHYEYQNEGSVLERYKPRDNETRNIAIYDMMLKYQ
ncbi:ankyrin repeat domain-containing protein [Pasteurellaceae bacterium USgator11]|nr:ankyrin repeat domain-containing protein [Pasteurellaceae bacterium USgator11]